MNPLGYRLKDIDFNPKGWTYDSGTLFCYNSVNCVREYDMLEDISFMQYVVQLNTGFSPALAACRAVWEARSEYYDVSWLFMPRSEEQLWKEIFHIFPSGWDKREGWLAKQWGQADPEELAYREYLAQCPEVGFKLQFQAWKNLRPLGRELYRHEDCEGCDDCHPHPPGEYRQDD